ncbi:MAG: YwaF family protein [Erysipelotrichaceae bacterium]|nr:YwaF family protein [Erysipelotrichaceae bacterium]
MFSWQHFVWLGICAVIAVISIILYRRKRPSLEQVLNYCLAVCLFSEVTKVSSVMEMASSADGSIIFPYIPMNHLPLHLCSIQILFILYVRFSENKKMRDHLLCFMYPSCLLGALAALLMPSIFSTSITVDQAFIHPMAYQFFIFHTMLVVLGLIIAMSGVIKWKWSHYFECLVIIAALGFISLYVNSIFASPTYLNGKLQHVDFWPNFFFTYNNPLGIKVTTIQGWYIYLFILCAVIVVLTFFCFLPLVKGKKKR